MKILIAVRKVLWSLNGVALSKEGIAFKRETYLEPRPALSFYPHMLPRIAAIRVGSDFKVRMNWGNFSWTPVLVQSKFSNLFLEKVYNTALPALSLTSSVV